MEENKNLTPENEAVEVAEAVENVETAKKPEVKAKKAKKAKLIKNQFALKRGGYSLAITAAVLAGIIIFNVLVSALADRFNLEFDMTTQKTNSMTEENIEFLKGIEQEINLTFCANSDNYAEYMAYYAQQYGVSENASNYYNQTLKLVEKYTDYNKNIKLNYVDAQSSEFSAITAKYSGETIGYGDIIVSTKNGDKEKHRVVGFKDIYAISQDDTYASYGYTTSTVSGNNIETALTSAIAYVTSSKTKKLAILTGHSKMDYTQEYREMLAENNYEVAIISDTLITEISNEFDAVVIVSPTIDFIGSEIDVLSKFLENDGKLDKGIMFYADVDSPALPNFYDFLSQWGIDVEEGILFETNSSNHLPDDPMSLGSYPTEDDDISKDLNFCLTGFNVPLNIGFESKEGIVVSALVATPESVVAAPKGTAKDWAGADAFKKQSYPTVVQAVKEDYDDDNNSIKSYIVAFSSMEFLYSPYNSQAAVSNRDITLLMAERLVKADESGIQFVSKTIETESFAESVNETSAKVMQTLFMIILPLLSIAAGIYIFIRRRNS